MSPSLEATLTLIDDLRRNGQDFCVVTVVRTANATSAKAGAKAVVTEDGTLHGFVGGSCVQGAVKHAALQVLKSGEPRLVRVKPKDEVDASTDRDGIELHGSSCPSGGTVEFFLEPTKQQMRLVICGSSPVADALLRLAHAMGYQTVAAASTSDLREAAPPHQSIQGFDLAALKLDQRDAIVVATQGRHDRAALESALRTPAGYVGMVGSRKKIASLLDQLDADIPTKRKQTLSGPAGLDLGAIDPEEIALSILGEIIQQKRRGR
ncbi:MAG: XdhC family protein [Geminicoccaceae bacterium]